MSPLPTTYTTTEVAEAFKVSTYYLLAMVRAGKVQPARTSASPRGHYRFFDEHIEQLKTAMQEMAPMVPSASTLPPRRRRRRRRT